jgi:GDP/UDP-N,N'-diacetylbacillosamine 2-epimerase (hydrolysing)
MKIGVLTSSRADYGIYLPLLEKIKNDPYFDLEIIAFGTHLSKGHGYTLSEILIDGYKIIHQISSLISDDSEDSIATSYALTTLKFSNFWKENKFDLVLCLGDRFEMSAAVQSGIIFRVNFAHIHGGESTLGAIDNIYRHQITIASKIHFTATKIFSKKITQLIGTSDSVYTVGSLSLNGINNFKPLEKQLFFKKYEISVNVFALATFHPETVNIEKNEFFSIEMKKALEEISKKMAVVITMPNADTMGSIYRKQITLLKLAYPDRIFCIENFGKKNYFSAMYHSNFLIGNTSSGIIEAATFGKYVVNIGDRQKGRLQSKNILNAKFEFCDIMKSVEMALSLKEFKGTNLYYQKDSVNKVIQVLKSYNEKI